MQANHFFGQLFLRLKRVYGLEFILQRPRSGTLDGALVHTRFVIVADFLFDGASPGSVRGRLFQNAADNSLAAFLQFVEAAPPGTVRRNGILCLPLAASVGVKICAGINILVEHVSVEADVRSLRFIGRRRHLRQAQDYSE